MRIASTMAHSSKLCVPGKPFLEDGVFGFRAAGPALLSNAAYFEKRICTWDPQTMTAS